MGRNKETADPVYEMAPRSFSYRELREATDDFKEEIGKGAFGTVFKGTMSGGEKAIAVKRLDRLVDEGERDFLTEMRAIGRTHHKNLVRLLGFCEEGSDRLLVYEYMSNGSLADLIFKTERRPPWNERVRNASLLVQLSRPRKAGAVRLHWRDLSTMSAIISVWNVALNGPDESTVESPLTAARCHDCFLIPVQHVSPPRFLVGLLVRHSLLNL